MAKFIEEGKKEVEERKEEYREKSLLQLTYPIKPINIKHTIKPLYLLNLDILSSSKLYMPPLFFRKYFPFLGTDILTTIVGLLKRHGKVRIYLYIFYTLHIIIFLYLYILLSLNIFFCIADRRIVLLHHRTAMVVFFN